MALQRGLPDEGWLFVVDSAVQQLAAWQAGRGHGRYPVSASLKGLGSEDGSGRTPSGWHEIADRIGEGAPPGQVFESREPVTRVVPPSAWADEDADDLILSRILRLRGLEPGVNQGPGVDSYDRFIYIHGTAQEHRLGTPASNGCIRMGNRDLIGLFRLIGPAPAWCWIGPLTSPP